MTSLNMTHKFQNIAFSQLVAGFLVLERAGIFRLHIHLVPRFPVGNQPLRPGDHAQRVVGVLILRIERDRFTGGGRHSNRDFCGIALPGRHDASGAQRLAGDFHRRDRRSSEWEG